MNTTDKIASSALLFSILSFGVSTCTTINQNELSIKPMLTFLSNETNVKLINSGSGIAIVEGVYIAKLDSSSNNKLHWKEISSAVQFGEILAEYNIEGKYSFNAIAPETPINSGSDLFLISSKDNESRDLNKVIFKIIYKDIKDNKQYENISKNTEWK